MTDKFKCFEVPAPGATLSVAAFLLLGIYGKVIGLVIASVVLGIGHIGIHLQHIKEFKVGEGRLNENIRDIRHTRK